MLARSLLVALCWVALLGCACGTKADPGSGSTPAVASDALCEHGVVSELCAKCNPDLAEVYRSSGDWCAEHGQAESFCPLCHPELKGRPKDSGAPEKPESTASKAPRDGMKVRLQSTEIIEGAGLLTVVAVKAPAKTSVRFPATIVYDATRSAEITASAGGVLRAVNVDLGAKVKIGDPLASLDSATIGGDRSKLAAAHSRVVAAKDRVERMIRLEKDGVVSRKDRIDAELARDDAQALVATLSAELSVSGASAGNGASYRLSSPIDGVVVLRNATVGKRVEEKEVLFQIVDPTVLWAEIAIPEARVSSVSEGAEVVLTFSSIPAEAFAGTIDVVLPEVDRETRTVTARVSLKNPELRLRANMFGEAAVLGDAPVKGVTIPRAAIQTVDRTRFVFVRKEALLFEVRHVTVPSQNGEAALLDSGLAAGEEVVTTGSFLLKTETLKDSIGAGCCGDD